MDYDRTSGVPPPGRRLIPGVNGGTLHACLPGVSGNPSGRPAVKRTVSRALAELQDTPGSSPAVVVANFKAARVKAGGLVGADHKAIALYKTETTPLARTQVNAQALAIERLEGKVMQPIGVDDSVANEIAARLARLLGEAAAESDIIDVEVIREGRSG